MTSGLFVISVSADFGYHRSITKIVSPVGVSFSWR